MLLKVCFRFLIFKVFFILIALNLQAQDMNRVRQNLNAFCAPDMHGRGYVNNGDKVAASFIEKQFKAAGLKPFPFHSFKSPSSLIPEPNDYYQKFTLPVNTIQETELKIGKITLKPSYDFIPAAGNSNAKGKLRILNLDTLIFFDEERGQKFLKQDLTKYVLLIPEKFWTKISVLPAAFKQKTSEAGALLITHKKITYTVAKNQQSQPQFDLLQTALPRAAKKVKFKTEAQFIPEYQTQNVIGFIPGKIQPDSFVVISAHYDHLGRIGKNTYFPGANDNASGTSMLLELAHYYGKPENQPAYSMVFMAFGAEEAGLVGSKFYVEHPLFPLSSISFLLNLDLNGTGDDGIMVVNGKIHEKEFRHLERLNKAKSYFPQVKSRGKAANSDHYPFSEKGVKAFFIYTLGGTTAYHDVQDTAENLPLTKFPELFRLLQDFANTAMQKN